MLSEVEIWNECLNKDAHFLLPIWVLNKIESRENMIKRGPSGLEININLIYGNDKLNCN